MAALSTIYPTLKDYADALGPDGKIKQSIVELLNLRNSIPEDMVWQEANDVTCHRSITRAGLPSMTWKQLNYGVQPTKDTVVQVTDTLGHIFGLAEIDADLLELNGNSADWLFQKHKAYIESMNQEYTDTFFYGNETTAPAEFTGLAPRYNSTSAENKDNLISGLGANGQTDCTSIWLIGLSPNTIYSIFPKGAPTGLQVFDEGIVMSENQGGTGLRGRVHRRAYSWKCGLVVEDWRYAVRIHSIDVSATTATGAGTGNDCDIVDSMIQALEVVPSLDDAKFAFYMNRKALTLLRRQIKTKTAYNLTTENIAGKHVTMFDGIPVRRCDAIRNTESSLN